MTGLFHSRDIDYLRGQFADRLDAHSIRDGSPALLAAAVARLDLHFAEAGTNTAAVLKLVAKTGGNRMR
ncbi:hypothetical protein [Mycolicibacterium hodleri]|uniref:Uncharacterized protein n=1 Tax=Mycolicibacterium hodleri TaxID=49897 RepID=A0A502DLP0_9MYCO|nr:hypothetical protein [Mycolicibacterium hodleri]TPG26173.1 hypothetical protein EAH80_29325 [Mycolicibacterium hodleri]